MGVGQDTALNLLGTITVASGSDTSTAFDLRMHQLIALEIPASFTGSGVNFLVSQDNDTFVSLYDTDGIVSLNVIASKRVELSPVKSVGIGRYFKIVSSSSEAADRSIGIIGRILR